MLSTVRFLSKRSALIVCSLLALLSVILVVVRVAADSSSPWQSTGAPTIQKVVELTPNALPSTSNSDCIPTSTRHYAGNATYEECLTTTAAGQASVSGIVLEGTSVMLPIVPPNPFQGVQPIPRQGMFYTTTSAPVMGSYMHFYRSIYTKITDPPTLVNGVMSYRITSNPDFALRDANGALLAVNMNTLTFSKNGNWMIVDIIGKGLVRINMATFDMLAFAPSLNPANDYSNVSAQISISSDGQNVVMKPSNSQSLKVINLASCNNAVLPVAPNATPCPVRDFWNDVTSSIPTFKSAYQPRFVNNTQVSLNVVYDFAPGNFKVATYTMTAPGVSATGIEYLGMGDSFASGEGAWSYIEGTDVSDNHCHLSTKSYANLFSSQLFNSGHAVSCSGAKMMDIFGNQDTYEGQTINKIQRQKRPPEIIRDALVGFTPGYLVQTEFIDTYKPEALTLSIGGNNIGFSDIVATCVSPIAQPKACYPTYEDRAELYSTVNGIFDDLVAIYKSVLKPGKRVYIVGYPQVAAKDGDCGVNVHLEPSEIEMATDLITYLNSTIESAANAAGVRYVDVSKAFDGHKLCEASLNNVAMNGLTAGNDGGVGPVKLIGSESYHPNALGHELMAQMIRQKTNNLTQPMPTANTATTAPSLPGNQRSLPVTGRATSNLIFDSDLTKDVVPAGQSISVQNTSPLKPNASYKVVVNGNQIGTATSDTNGIVTTTVQVPNNIELGFQKFELTGQNILGQPLTITKTVYISGASDDKDVDGISDAIDTCDYTPNSGQDYDRDGIDDACDPLIGLPPPLKLSNLKSSVTLSQNSITITRP